MRLLVVCLLACLVACHRAATRPLTKADLDGVNAQMYSPGALSPDEVARKIGPPAQVEGGRSTWFAKEGSTCWAFWVMTYGAATPAMFALEQARCPP
jgi:hypothetical protein